MSDSKQQPFNVHDNKDSKVPDEHHVHRRGGWMSQDKRHHHHWMKKTVKHVDENPKELQPVLREFQKEVERDPRLYMLFNNMFEQVPQSKPYLHDPSGEISTVRDFPHLLQLFNHILTTAPHWSDAGHSVGVVGVPINAVLDWAMATPAGFCAFQDPKVNKLLKKVLNVWGEYLQTEDSASVLGTGKEDWFGETGEASLLDVGNLGGKTNFKFEEMFHCDPNAKNHGYNSWDEFFTRNFKDSFRPIAEPEDDDIVANACESKTYKVARDVKARDKFWIKGQPYSVMDMLASDPLAHQFIGGTIYQAFLSALSYHRWHTPISGTIKKAYVVDGTYFSEPLWEDFGQNKDGADVHGETTSQEYISAVAARAIIFIEADNVKLGTVAFIGIGMTEVSTCEITVKEGDKVKKGQQLGMFHFGGSSHCVLFRKGVKVSGFPEAGASQNVPVRSKLCVVE